MKINIIAKINKYINLYIHIYIIPNKWIKIGGAGKTISKATKKINKCTTNPTATM